MSDGPLAPAAPRARRRRRWLRCLGVALLVPLLLLALTLALLSRLHAGPVKTRLRALLREQAGIELDFATGSLAPLSGLRFTGVRLPTPAPYDGAAPDLARIGEISLRWSLFGLLRGQRLDEVVIRDVELVLVRDAEGESSLAGFLDRLPKSTAPEPPRVPLSRLVQSLLPAAPVELRHLVLERLSLVVIDRRGGEVTARHELGSLSIEGGAQAGPAGITAQLGLGRAGTPLDLVYRRHTVAGSAADRQLRLRLADQLRLAPPGDASMALSLQVTDQDLLPRLPRHGQALDFTLAVQLLPEQRRTRVALSRFALLDGALAGSAELDLMEGDDGGLLPVVRELKAQLDLERLLPLLPESAGEIAAPRGRLTCAVRDLELLPALRLRPAGTIEVNGELPRFSFASGATRVELRDGTLSLSGRADGAQAIALDLRLPVHALTLDAGVRATLTDPVLKASLTRLRVPLLDGGAIAGEATVSLELPAAEVAVGGGLLSLRRAALTLAAPLPGPGAAISLRGALPAAEVTFTDHDASRLQARELRLRLDIAGARLATPWLTSTGRLGLAGELGQLSIRRAGREARFDQMSLEVAAKLAGRSPHELTLRAPVGRFSLRDQHGEPLFAPAPGRIELAASRILIDPLDATRSRARLKASLDLGPLQATLDADKQAAQGSFTLHAATKSLAFVPLLLSATFRRDYVAPWDTMSLRIDSQATIGGFDALRRLAVDEKTKLLLRGGAIRGPGIDLAAPALELESTSKGTLQRHQIDLVARLTDARVASRSVTGTQRLRLHVGTDLADPRQPHGDFTLEGDGPLGPAGKLGGQFSYEAGRRALLVRSSGGLRRLGLLPLLLPADLRQQHRLDWDRLGVSIDADAELRELLLSLDGRGKYRLAARPLEALRGHGHLALTLTEVGYQGTNALALDASALRLEAVLRAEDEAGRHAEATLTVPSAGLRVAGQRVTVQDFAPRAEIDFAGDPRQGGDVRLLMKTTARSITQTFFAGYPIGDLSLVVKAHGDARLALRLDELRLDNPGGGTTLTLQGGFDLPRRRDPVRVVEELAPVVKSEDAVPGRRGLLVQGTLTQQLEPLDLAAWGVIGRGRVTTPLRIESGDFTALGATLRPRFEAVEIELPARRLAVRGLNGELPVAAEFAFDPRRGLTALGGARASAFTRLRFADHRPFLDGGQYLAADSVRFRDVTIGPLAANARLDRNLISLDQLEATLGSGKLTGQCLIDLHGDDTEVALRLATTGLRLPGASEEERVDGNLALALKPLRLALSGRAEIVRIGRRHLNHLLDVYDPYREDVTTNRTRQALALGFPKRVRVQFDHGFARFAITLGGLAGAVRVDEIQGIALGPLLQRFVAPVLTADGAGGSR